MGQGPGSHADETSKPTPPRDLSRGGSAGSTAGTAGSSVANGTRDCRRYCVFEEMDHCDGSAPPESGNGLIMRQRNPPQPRRVHAAPEVGKCCIPWCDGDDGIVTEVEETTTFGPRLPPDHFAVLPTSSTARELGLGGNDVFRSAFNPDPPVLRAVKDAKIPNGGVFTGQVNSNGRPHGDGVQVYPDGAIYEGQWIEGAAHGLGELRLQNGKGYAGQWQAGLKHGEGSEHYESGAHYKGSFACGAKEGSGTLTWANGAVYYGDFRCGKCHGEGQLRYVDGREYCGQWQSGAMHGVGAFSWPDGKSYTGHYREDKRHGPGVFTWPDGSLCKGRWENGKLHGSGTYVDADGQSWHGRWIRGERQYWTD